MVTLNIRSLCAFELLSVEMCSTLKMQFIIVIIIIIIIIIIIAVNLIAENFHIVQTWPLSVTCITLHTSGDQCGRSTRCSRSLVPPNVFHASHTRTDEAQSGSLSHVYLACCVLDSVEETIKRPTDTSLKNNSLRMRRVHGMLALPS